MIKNILFSAAILGAAATATALPQAVCFRFDDNQNAKKYTVMADVFRKNNVRFSLSLNPLLASLKNTQWLQMVQTLSQDGFEVMDHTPQHNTLSVFLKPQDPLLKKAQNAPFVDHITNGIVCFKYDMTGVRWSAPFTIEIKDGNKISDHPAFKIKRIVEIGGKHYYVHPRKRKLLSLWAEDNVKLPDAKVQARWCLPILPPYPGTAEFLLEVSQEGFRRIGLKKMPQTWIQPGGFYPLLEKAALSKVLKKYGYTGATTNPGVVKGFGDPEIALNRFALDWGDFNLERMPLAEIKTRIADAIACHRTPIASSHLWIKETIEEHALKHDQLLQWLKANNIQVLTQKEIADLLHNTKIERHANAFPALDRDLDKNGRPDGILAAKNVVFSSHAAVLAGTGKKLEVKQLCGLPKGKAVFRFNTDKAFSSVLQIHYFRADKKPVGTHSASVSAVPGKNSCPLTIPDQCAFLNFQWIKTSPENAAVSALELVGTN